MGGGGGRWGLRGQGWGPGGEKGRAGPHPCSRVEGTERLAACQGPKPSRMEVPSSGARGQRCLTYAFKDPAGGQTPALPHNPSPVRPCSGRWEPASWGPTLLFVRPHLSMEGQRGRRVSGHSRYRCLTETSPSRTVWPRSEGTKGASSKTISHKATPWYPSGDMETEPPHQVTLALPTTLRVAGEAPPDPACVLLRPSSRSSTTETKGPSSAGQNHQKVGDGWAGPPPCLTLGGRGLWLRRPQVCVTPHSRH